MKYRLVNTGPLHPYETGSLEYWKIERESAFGGWIYEAGGTEAWVRQKMQEIKYPQPPILAVVVEEFEV